MMIWGLSGFRKVIKMCPDSRADIQVTWEGALLDETLLKAKLQKF